MLGIGDGPARQQSVVFAACNFDVSWYGHLKLACGEVGGSIEALGVERQVAIHTRVYEFTSGGGGGAAYQDIVLAYFDISHPGGVIGGEIALNTACKGRFLVRRHSCAAFDPEVAYIDGDSASVAEVDTQFAAFIAPTERVALRRDIQHETFPLAFAGCLQGSGHFQRARLALGIAKK